MELLNHTLGSILTNYANTTPDQEFIVYPDRGFRFTYKEFDKRTDNLAKSLLHIGVEKGDKVGVWAKNVPDWLTFMFATAKIGAILVTINTNYKKSELEYILKAADIKTMCISAGFRDSDFVEIMYNIAPEIKNSERGDLHCEKLPMLKNIIYMGHEKLRGLYNMGELLSLGTALSNNELDEIKATISTHDTVNMQYTSGTTGFPKGVMLSHYNILNNGHSVGECMHYTSEEKLLTCVPLFHCFGCVLAVCAIVSHGATLVMLEDFDPLAVLASIEKEKCTALYGVPTMFIAELNHPMFSMFDLTSLRTGIMAGAPCPIETLKQVMTSMNCKDIISVYGLTETSPGMTASRVTDSAELRATTVGTELPGVEVRILNAETNEEVERGQIGEVCCRGYNIMKGYYNNPEATEAVIDSNGFLHSGDLGIMDENGYLRITGRIKEMIIRGGENIYPREIENFLYQMEEIKTIEIVGIPSPRYGEQVAAFINTKEDKVLTEAMVTTFCRGQIAHYKIPKYIFFVDEFPMTASGKIQKYLLKDVAAKILGEMNLKVL